MSIPEHENVPLFIGGTTEGPDDEYPFEGTAILLNQSPEFFHIPDYEVKEDTDA